MAKFKFIKETDKRVVVAESYEIEADTYDEAVEKLRDADMEIESVGTYISTNRYFPDEYYTESDYSTIINEYGEEID